jgi:hypothetical protein
VERSQECVEGSLVALLTSKVYIGYDNDLDDFTNETKVN